MTLDGSLLRLPFVILDKSASSPRV